jgi:hypothetical protein
MPYGEVQESGSFTSDGTDHFIPLRADVDWMEVDNFTQQATTQNPGRGISFKWQRGMADDVGLMVSKENAADTVTYESLASGGFLRIEESQAESLEAAPANAITAITAADPAVVSQTSHGYQTGDVVRLTGTTGMLQIAGMDFHVTRVDANSYQLTYLDASGFAAAATAGASRRYLYENPFTPRKKYINSISAAGSAVVELTALHGYAVGEVVRFYVPAAFGMVEMNELQGEITAVATNTITVDINSTAFTAFAFPASGSVPFTQAHVVPVGDAGNVLSGAVRNSARLVMRLAAGVDSPAGSNSDVIYWKAGKSALNTAE